MPIPDRLRPHPPTAEEVAEYTDLCRLIERGGNGAGVDQLLARWNHRAGPGSHYSASDFGHYWAMNIDWFVAIMLMGEPPFVADLTYRELRDVVETYYSGTMTDAEENYYLRWLETNLPDANVTDLIANRDSWFGFPEADHIELTPDQFLAYAMKKSGRTAPGAPENVPLPYPIPPRTGA
jgi:hypothetical protein